MPAGLPRLTKVVLSCLGVPSSLCPNVSSDFFFPLPSLLSPSLLPGSTQVKRLPSLSSPLPSWITSSRHVSFSFLCVCVYLSYFSFSPFLFTPPPFLPCNWRMCYEVANSWTVRLLFFQMPPCLPSHLSPPLPSFSLSIEYSTFWKLETIKERERERTCFCLASFSKVWSLEGNLSQGQVAASCPAHPAQPEFL